MSQPEQHAISSHTVDIWAVVDLANKFLAEMKYYDQMFKLSVDKFFSMPVSQPETMPSDMRLYAALSMDAMRHHVVAALRLRKLKAGASLDEARDYANAFDTLASAAEELTGLDMKPNGHFNADAFKKIEDQLVYLAP